VLRTVEPVVVSAEGGPETELEKPDAGLAVYPNPSRASAGGVAVALTLAEPAEVRVTVVDVLGREVAVLHDGHLGTGGHAFALDAALSSGVYIVRFTESRSTTAQRFTVVR
jgi:hypothetical protein